MYHSLLVFMLVSPFVNASNASVPIPFTVSLRYMKVYEFGHHLHIPGIYYVLGHLCKLSDIYSEKKTNL